jgi:hypothetical protein
MVLPMLPPALPGVIRHLTKRVRMLVRSGPTRAGAVRAGLAVVAVIVSYCAMLAIGRALGAGTQPALLGAILTLGVSRRPEHVHASRAAFYPLALAAVALVAGGVGLLLHAIALAGAVAFVAGIFLSIWLRNFGERGRRIGSLIALPFVTMLVVPIRPIHAPGGPLVDLLAIVAAGLVALASVRVVGALATVLPLVPQEAEGEPDRPTRARKPGAVTIPTRMAIQMTVALALAFAAGFALFARHWGWTVLTAFIVCSGAIGRGDAAYKALLRVIGAIGGTAAATLLTYAWHPAGPLEAIAIFIALFFGLWLRDTNYAYWAACITLVLALLAQPSATETATLLGLRVVAIVAGALCAIAATWFVLPIRTTDVIRRRLADALAALDAIVANDPADPAAHAFRLAAFERRMFDLERVAAPVRLHRRALPLADHREHPGRWIDLARDCRRHAHDIDVTRLSPAERAQLRRSIGATRKAIGAHTRTRDVSHEPAIAAHLQTVSDALRMRRDGRSA